MNLKTYFKDLFIKFLDNLKNRIFSILPIIVSSIFVLIFMSIIIKFIEILLPTSSKSILHLISQKSTNIDIKSIREFFSSYNNYKELFFISVQVLQVFFAPIPGQISGLIGGIVFGFWKGLILTMTGLLIGSTLAMYFGRIIGYKLIRKFVSKKVMQKFDFLVENNGIFNFFILFLLPAFPDDAICFIAGITRLNIYKLMVVCFIGRLPGMMVLTFIGSNLEEDIIISKILFSVSILIAFIVWVFSDEILKKFQNFNDKIGENVT